MTNQTIKPEFSRVYLIFIFLFFVNTQLFSQNFITKWNFTAAGTSISFNAQTAGGPVNYTWTCAPSGNTGTGSFTQTTAGNVTLSGLNIPAGNTVTLSMTPTNLRRFYINSGVDRLKLIDVMQWGAVPWTNMTQAFNGCNNLNITASDIPNLSSVSDMSFMFILCTTLNGPTNINSWNTSICTNMESMFAYATVFNQNISSWNTSNCTNMKNMFSNASSFNQNIGLWNTSACTNMSAMFANASAFNQNISSWNISVCMNLSSMFQNAQAFNQPIGAWNTFSCTNMAFMFSDASAFNQNIGSWNTSACTNMANMFSGASTFNQNIGSWNTSSCIDMSGMFGNASLFNQNIGSWNTAACTNMSFMFAQATAFNQYIGNWNTAACTNMTCMFLNDWIFNQNIGNWNTSACTNMSNMFDNANSFNQNIGTWNTAACTNMSSMFSGADAFNQNLGAWKLNPNVNLTSMLTGNGMDCSNYTATLMGWATNNPTVTGRSLGAIGRNYGTNAVASRNTLVTSRSWTITGDVALGTVCSTCATLVATKTQTNVSCFGGNNGTATVIPSGGTSFTYEWSPTDNPNQTQLGMTAGTYVCMITNECGNNFYVTVNITQPPALNLTLASQTNVSCFGGANGSATVNPATGGTGSKTYAWSPGGGTGTTITGKTAGVYTCTVTDANGCTKSLNVTITQPTSPLSGSTTVTNVSCFSGSNGAINLTASGGTAPYSYNWGGGITTEDRTGLSAGTYSVTITDANGCTSTVNTTITQPPSALSGTRTLTNVSCFGGSNGTINLTPAGGTAPYTFNWGGGVTTEDRTGLTAGAYSVTITDANGCTTSVNATITQPVSALSGTTTFTNVSCFGGANGTINLTPAGGTAPYTFNWGGGVTAEDRTGLSAGAYSVTITDANGCTSIVNTTITQPLSALSGTTTFTNVSCFGGSNGTINLTASGGTAPYTFNWGSGITTEDRSSLTAGSYSVSITDANGCSTIVNTTITQPTALSGTTTVTNVSCFGGSNGTINLTATGGIAPYSYNWGGGITTEDLSSLSQGSYSVTITDGNSCTANVNATITQPAFALSATTTSTDVTCFGGSNGTINLTASGGTAPYSYDWGGGITTEDRSSLPIGTYSVTITDANGCTFMTSATINQPVPIETSFNQTACDSYTWNAINYSSSGQYIQNLTSVNGCDSTVTMNLTILTSSSFAISDTACDSYILNGQTYVSSGTYTQVFTNAVGCDSIITLNLIINNSTTSNITTSACDSITINGQTFTSSGVYSQLLTNASGCDSTLTLNLTINNSTSSIITTTACDTITINGQTFTASGVYSQLLTNASGCDSTITLNLTINNTTNSTAVETACNSFTWQANGTTYTNSGTYLHTLQNSMGCDSLLTLNLTINSSTTPTIINQADTLLFVNEIGSYQWIDCATNQLLVGETSSSFEPIVNGQYAVIFTNNNLCTDTSLCEVVASLGIATYSFDKSVSIFPNPSNGLFQIETANFVGDIEVYDAAGRKIYTGRIDKNTLLDLSTAERGIYYLYLKDEISMLVKKIEVVR